MRKEGKTSDGRHIIMVYERQHCVVCTTPEIPYAARDDFINTEFHHSLSKHTYSSNSVSKHEG